MIENDTDKLNVEHLLLFFEKQIEALGMTKEEARKSMTSLPPMAIIYPDYSDYSDYSDYPINWEDIKSR